MICNNGKCKEIREGITHTKKNTCAELNMKNNNHKLYYIAFLVIPGMSVLSIEIFIHIFSDLNMTLMYDCFVNNIDDTGLMDKSGFDICNRNHVNRFNIILPAFITLLVLSVIITKLFVISEMKRIDQKISDLINIKMEQYVSSSIK